MATALATTTDNAIAHTDPTKWLTPIETSALEDRGTILPFSAEAAAKVFPADRLRELILRHDAALMPVEPGKLAARLRALWESTTAPQNLTAKSWLHETGRLLSDLPLAIVYAAIDMAVLESERGFTPSAGAIRKHAEANLAVLKRTAARLRATKAAQDAPSPPRDATAADAGDQRTTAQILADAWPTMSQHETGDREVQGSLDPNRPCRTPTREDYLRMGVAPEALDAMNIGVPQQPAKAA